MCVVWLCGVKALSLQHMPASEGGKGGDSEGPWFSAPAAPLSVQLPMPAPIILREKLLFLCRPAFGDRRMGLSSGQTDFLPWAGSSAAP